MIFFILHLSPKCAVYQSITNSLLTDIIYTITNLCRKKSENFAVGLIKLILFYISNLKEEPQADIFTSHVTRQVG